MACHRLSIKEICPVNIRRVIGNNWHWIRTYNCINICCWWAQSRGGKKQQPMHGQNKSSNWGLSHQLFFHQISNLMAPLIWFHPISNNNHWKNDKKNWLNRHALMASNWITTKQIFHWIWIVMKKNFSEIYHGNIKAHETLMTKFTGAWKHYSLKKSLRNQYIDLFIKLSIHSSFTQLSIYLFKDLLWFVAISVSWAVLQYDYIIIIIIHYDYKIIRHVQKSTHTVYILLCFL